MRRSRQRKCIAPDSLLESFKDYLIRGQYKPGDRIETEQQLASRFNVTRFRMREVTTTLCQLGVLESRPRRGTILKSFDPASTAEHLGFHFAIAGLSPADSREARMVIEEAILPLVVRRATPVLLSEMREAILRMESGVDNVRQVYQADKDFHLLLLKACGNRTLQAFAQVIVEIFDRQYPGMHPSPGVVKSSIKEHWQLLEALEEGDLAVAQSVLRRHLGRGSRTRRK